VKVDEAAPAVQIDPRLAQDSHLLGWLGGTRLLLMRNAHFPWFVLVPATGETEFYKLDAHLQSRILAQINQLADFIQHNFQIDKINIGMIGNIVSQLHIHVIGRRRDDICWPGVVWGTKEFRHYQPEQVEKIAAGLTLYLADRFRADPDCI